MTKIREIIYSSLKLLVVSLVLFPTEALMTGEDCLLLYMYVGARSVQ